MRNHIPRDIPSGAAAAIVALALVASVVTGRERATVTEVVQPEDPRAAEPVPVQEDLDVAKLVRQREKRPIHDLFASRAPAALPPVVVVPSTPVVEVKPEPPPAPSAPALPYNYLGRMQRGDKIIVYLLKGQEVLIAETGAALENLYRVEAVSASAVHLVYIPLGVKQVLPISAAP